MSDPMGDRSTFSSQLLHSSLVMTEAKSKPATADSVTSAAGDKTATVSRPRQDRQILIEFDPSVVPGTGQSVNYLPYQVTKMTDGGEVLGEYEFFDLIPGVQEISESIFEQVTQAGTGAYLVEQGALSMVSTSSSILEIGRGTSRSLALSQQIKLIRGAESAALLNQWLNEVSKAQEDRLVDAIQKRLSELVV